MIGLPDFKTPVVYALGVLLLVVLAGLGMQTVRLADARAELATEKAARATETAQRAQVALTDAQTVAGAESTHAGKQQEIVHDLTKPDPALAVALADNRALNQRLRDTSAKLAAASDRRETQGDAAACGNLADQYRAVIGLLQEASRLAIESGDLAYEGGRVIGQRDREVKALKALVMADRALMEDAAGPTPPPDTADR